MRYNNIKFNLPPLALNFLHRVCLSAVRHNGKHARGNLCLLHKLSLGATEIGNNPGIFAGEVI